MKRILIIDDATTVRSYYKNILEPAGYLVDEAINGIEGLEKAFSTPYDLYLVDINMPKLDGYSFVRELRSNTEIPQKPALMISSDDKLSQRAKAYEAGATLFVVKPIRPEVLLGHAHLLLEME